MAAPTDWYVDPVNGSDSNGGTSLVDAWLTFSYAYTTVTASESAAGDTINLRNNATDTIGDGGLATIRRNYRKIGM